MIIYPPLIADTIPAFTTDKIVIPFSQNPAVSSDEILKVNGGFKLLVKDYINSTEITTLNIKATKEMFDVGEIVFTNITDISNKFPIAKQYYKFQLAYNDNSGYYAYSSASIGRCIGDSRSTFNISVLDCFNKTLNSSALNLNTTNYIGKYVTNILSEPIHSYRFIFKNKLTNEIIQDTGEVLHNVDNDKVSLDNRITSHNFKLKYELVFGEQYELTYSIVTINGYTEKVSYSIIKSGQLPSVFQGGIIVEQDETAKDNGYVKISISNKVPYRGNFIIERTSDNKEWNELTKFSITKISDLSNFTWKDWSVEQGVTYTYALKQYVDNQYSERIKSKPITVEFEHMYLSDGKRQLKIEYNPKVSSFKDTILEQKTDTIGGQYPFFFRNSQVRYKEIPISGLISYQMDGDNFFMSDDDLELINLSSVKEIDTVTSNAFDNLKTRTTQLTNYNYAAERKFKLAVLEWLTNGEPKLFRSPAEGNYVIRLMNTSLSPNDTLGRMLHTFNSTGYEIADNDTATLLHEGLINLPELKDPEPDKIFQTLDLNWLGEEDSKVFEGREIENIVWYTNLPNFNDYIILTDTNNQENNYYNTTGVFTTPSGVLFNSIVVTREILINGAITFQYYPDLTEAQGEDTFAKMVKASEDVLFSVPAEHTLYGENPILIDPETGNATTIYKTYALIVRKDINTSYKNPEAYQLQLGDTIIDCSDGQTRYYYDLDPSVEYEKGLGLHLDIYARIQVEGASSLLGSFILGSSYLN